MTRAGRARLVAFALAATASVALGAAAADHSPGAKQGQRPNIVLVVTDDQTLAMLNQRTMPHTASSVAGAGTTFANAVVTTPLCCPSRATHITGQYGHNNGVLNNRPGYPDLRDPKNVLPSWLRAAGYYTAHVGRYLNEYPNGKRSRPAPGWDEWIAALEPRSYFDYELRMGRERIEYGKRARDYLTNVFNRLAKRVIRKRASGSRPLYLQVDHFAPHGGPGKTTGPCADGDFADPLRADYAAFAAEPLPTPPSFNEPDVNDKPSFMQVGPLTDDAVATITQRYRCNLASLRAVDRGLAGIDAALAKAGELQNTVVIFTSDNGFFYGEHRLPREKIRPYEEALRVPLVIRAPSGVLGTQGPATVNELVANTDLAPTILDLAGAAPCLAPDRCRVMDGRSLVPLLRGQGGWPADRGVVVEFAVANSKFNVSSSCAYHGLRTPGYLYVRHTSVPAPPDGTCTPADERELYDLAADPYELDNLHPPVPSSPAGALEASLDARLAALANCAGIEGRDPAPPSGSYCE